MKKINVAIVGITGYTGEELLKLLSRHPHAQIAMLASRSAGAVKPLGELYPHLNHLNLTYEPFNAEAVNAKADVVFLALPHKVSFEFVPELMKAGKKVIDLSADFRLENVATYEKWYGGKHTADLYLKDAVYGLPEVYRAEIKKTQLV